MESQSARAIFFAVGGFVSGVALMSVSGELFHTKQKTVIAISPKRPPAAATSTNQVVPASSEAALSIRAQPATTSVVVQSVSLGVPGWLVVHELTDGHVANALGAARRDAGTHTDAAIELLRPTESRTPYMLVLYRDNGNKEFDLRGDIPIVDGNGDPVMQRFETL